MPRPILLYPKILKENKIKGNKLEYIGDGRFEKRDNLETKWLNFFGTTICSGKIAQFCLILKNLFDWFVFVVPSFSVWILNILTFPTSWQGWGVFLSGYPRPVSEAGWGCYQRHFV